MELVRRVVWFCFFGGAALLVISIASCAGSCVYVAGGSDPDGAAGNWWTFGAVMFYLGLAGVVIGLVLSLVYRAISGK